MFMKRLKIKSRFIEMICSANEILQYSIVASYICDIFRAENLLASYKSIVWFYKLALKQVNFISAYVLVAYNL